jgi:hypothetical protein
MATSTAECRYCAELEDVKVTATEVTMAAHSSSRFPSAIVRLARHEAALGRRSMQARKPAPRTGRLDALGWNAAPRGALIVYGRRNCDLALSRARSGR